MDEDFASSGVARPSSRDRTHVIRMGTFLAQRLSPSADRVAMLRLPVCSNFLFIGVLLEEVGLLLWMLAVDAHTLIP